MRKPLAVLVVIGLAANLSMAVMAENDDLPASLQRGLLLRYSFDQQPVNWTVPDVSGQHNNGRAVNVQWVPDGHRGGSALFGLTNSYIHVPNDKSLNPTRLTLAAWIKTSYHDNTWRRIIDKGYGHGFDLTMGGNYDKGRWQGQAVFETATASVFSGLRVDDGRWHHVAGVFDGRLLIIYVDGNPLAGVGEKGEPIPTMYDLTIGANHSNPSPADSGSFNGQMDDVMMYSRALSDTEIHALTRAQQMPGDPAVDAPDLAGFDYGMYVQLGMQTFSDAGDEAEVAATEFAPTDLDAPGWAAAAKAAGMKFAILNVKGDSGLCLWKTADYDYDLAHSGCKRDIIREFITACQANGIVPGAHYGIVDAHNEGALRYNGAIGAAYFALIKKQLAELQTLYPELRIQTLWGDGRLSPAQVEDLSRVIKKANPHCAWWRFANFNMASISKSWLWKPDQALNPAFQLFNQYKRARFVGKPFVLNVGPDRSGHIPQNQLAALKEMTGFIADPDSADAAAAAAKSAASQPAPAAPAAASAPERLKKLKDLLDQGLIDKTEYDKKRKEILDSL